MIKAERVVDFTPDENYFETLSKRLGSELRRGARARLAAAVAEELALGAR